MRPATVIGEGALICLDLAEMLAELGFAARVYALGDGAVAARLLEGERPALLVVETTVPSAALLATMRELLAARVTPVVAIATVRPPRLLAQFPPSPVACLDKPFTEAELAAAVARVVAP